MTNWHTHFHESRTLPDRIADSVANFIGSWNFILIQTGIFVVWVLINSLTLFHFIQFDPFPFILFNLVMSAEAAYSSPLIMMSQNRQALRDRHQADNDYQCNIEAKKEIEQLQQHVARIEIEKLDKIIALLEKGNGADEGT